MSIEKLYKLRPEKKHTHFDGVELHQLKAGDVVPLTDTQAKAFGDKFEPATGSATYPNRSPRPAPSGNPGVAGPVLTSAESDSKTAKTDTK